MIDSTTLDAALASVRDNADVLYLCSAAPTTYTEASSTYKLGTKSSPTINTPEAATGGRKIVLAAISDGTVDSAGTATHMAICDVSATRLILVKALSSSKSLVTGTPWTSSQIDLLTIAEA